MIILYQQNCISNIFFFFFLIDNRNLTYRDGKPTTNNWKRVDIISYRSWPESFSGHENNPHEFPNANRKQRARNSILLCFFNDRLLLPYSDVWIWRCGDYEIMYLLCMYSRVLRDLKTICISIEYLNMCNEKLKTVTVQK